MVLNCGLKLAWFPFTLFLSTVYDSGQCGIYLLTVGGQWLFVNNF